MRHTGTVINVRHFPELRGLTYKVLRQGFPRATVCGVVLPGNKVVFHPLVRKRRRGAEVMRCVLRSPFYAWLPSRTRTSWRKTLAMSERVFTS